MRADQSDVAFRFLIALGELWDGLHRAGINPSRHGIHLTKEYLGGYARISAGPSSHSRLIFEWHESSNHVRVLRCEDWQGFEAAISSTVKHVREDAKTRGILDVVDRAFVRACEPPATPIRITRLAQKSMASAPVAPAGARRP